MNGKIFLAATICLTCMSITIGCDSHTNQAGNRPLPAPWQLEELSVLTGFDAPECVVVDTGRDLAFISNIGLGKGGPWEKDGTGFISLMEKDALLKKLRWRDSTEEFPLNAPHGMCVCKGLLYVADIDHVMTYDIDKGTPEVVQVPDAKMLNDLVAHEGYAYVSDTATGTIWKLGLPIMKIKGPPSANGLAFDKQGRMYCVSFEKHDIYEVNPNGVEEPKPLGLADHFKGLDGIEILDDGTMIVSDYLQNRVFSVSADDRAVHILDEVDKPADIGIDRKRRFLYVPMMAKNSVKVYKIRHR